ncbi:MAG: ATP-binding cassette domain-containing protein, partial [Bacteroidales bacterium]|nr:ATP-binding cassette domain-containing protein [Bacteroidales bacterium]
MGKDMNYMIKADNISVKMSRKFTLGPLTFTIPKKSVVGIIGANGSGKTILISTLVGLIKPTTGFVKIHSNFYGVALQIPSYYPNKTVLQNLSIFSGYNNVQRTEIEQLLVELDISIYKNKKTSQKTTQNG